jgi:uncharacterized oligopeptide transporter (OPT) family protein
LQQIGLLIGALTSAVVIGYTLNLLNDASTVYSKQGLPQNLVVNVATLHEKQKVGDPVFSSDKADYFVLRVPEDKTGTPYAQLNPGKYLVDAQGKLQYFVDPGINGSLKKRDDGTPVQKYEAPKARLMSLIIDGILTQKLPWGLVLLGAAISIIMELCGVPSLPFAVGVYLPLSVSSPIFFGGFIRWLVTRFRKKEETVSEADEESGSGVLFSSGLIAGGSIAGIGLALLALAPSVSEALALGPMFPSISESQWLPALMFTIMMAVLYKMAKAKTSIK